MVNGSAAQNVDFDFWLDPALVHLAEPYSTIADLLALPGKQPGEPISIEDEGEREQRRKLRAPLDAGLASDRHCTPKGSAN